MPKVHIRLQHFLTIPFVFVISLAVLVSGFLTWRLSEKSILDLGHQLNKQSSVLVQERLSAFLKNASFANNSVKQVVSEDGLHAKNRSHLQNHIKYIVKNNKAIGTVGMGYDDGSYFGIGRSDKGVLQKKIATPENKRMFYTYELPNYTKVYERPNYNATVRPWYKEALATSKPVWSSVYEMFSSKQLGITLSEAVYDKQNSYFGVVGTDIVFKDLGQQLREMRVTENTYIFILDREQHLIAHSDVKNQNLSKLVTASESDNELLKKSHAFINKYRITSKDFFDTADLEVNGKNERYYINYVPFGQEQGLNWYIGVVIPDSDFLENVNEIKLRTLMVWLASFLASVIVGVLITFYINKSIKTLQDKVNYHSYENINETNINGVFHHIKEVDDLSIAFSKMSKRLQDTFLEVKQSNEMLEDTVSERTKELKQANLELLKLSKTDKLTQLANRHCFEELLDSTWQQLEDGEINHISFMMCDIDYFKQYNDFYGHLVGDDCIISVAKSIASSIRDTDIAARYGGEEFAIILPNAQSQNAHRAATNIQERLAEKQIEHKRSKVSEYITLSIGVVTISQKDIDENVTKSTLVQMADDALYDAKENGRNKIGIKVL